MNGVYIYIYEWDRMGYIYIYIYRSLWLVVTGTFMYYMA